MLNDAIMMTWPFDFSVDKVGVFFVNVSTWMQLCGF